MTTMPRMRFFAAAKAAVGAAEMSLSSGPDGEPLLLGAAVDAVEASLPAERRDGWRAVAARCSYLVDGVATTDRATPLTDAATVDVMPPFSGG